MLDACGVEHVMISAMRHGYVQYSRLGCNEISNYRRKELQLLTELAVRRRGEPVFDIRDATGGSSGQGCV